MKLKVEDVIMFACFLSLLDFDCWLRIKEVDTSRFTVHYGLLVVKIIPMLSINFESHEGYIA